MADEAARAEEVALGDEVAHHRLVRRGAEPAEHVERELGGGRILLLELQQLRREERRVGDDVVLHELVQLEVRLLLGEQREEQRAARVIGR